MTLTPHPHLVPSSRKSRAVPLLPLWTVRPVQSLSACTSVHCTFFFLITINDLKVLPVKSPTPFLINTNTFSLLCPANSYECAPEPQEIYVCVDSDSLITLYEGPVWHYPHRIFHSYKHFFNQPFNAQSYKLSYTYLLATPTPTIYLLDLPTRQMDINTLQ